MGSDRRRTGARRIADVTSKILRDLEAGAASANHIEQMAMDMSQLLIATVPEAEPNAHLANTSRFLDRMRACSDIVWDQFGEDLFTIAQQWPSDTSRGWAAFAVSRASGGFERQAGLAMRFASDEHFAVREWAWLGLRPAVVDDPEQSIRYFPQHVTTESALIRRFCAEVTRPRSVWGRHIPVLRSEPERGESIIDPLVLAPERYVRDAVANWVNDVADRRPDWVQRKCSEWRDRHGDQVAYVVRRASRSLSR